MKSNQVNFVQSALLVYLFASTNSHLYETAFGRKTEPAPNTGHGKHASEDNLVSESATKGR